ncbi:hypothetical protein ACWDF1_00550 [Streptomyces coelicoflavus]|uniref:hypothetical protein n=1 Tax=Streptomyces coelicoflavus TaxID=285562 RepID=UPI003320B2C3
MRPIATQRAEYGRQPATVPGASTALPEGLSPATAEEVLRTRRFDHGLYVTRAAGRAARALRDSVPSLAATPRLGLVLATDRGDQHALLRRLPEFGSSMQRGERAATDLFRSIAYFPVGRIARSVSALLGAHGPVATVPADPGQAGRLAQLWLAAHRADQVVVVTAELTGDEEASATAELWQTAPGSRPAPTDPSDLSDPSDPTDPTDPHGRPVVPLTVTGHVERPHTAGGLPWAELLESALTGLAPEPGRRTALVVTSLLADAGEQAFAALSPRDAGPPLSLAVPSTAGRLGFDETLVLVGSSGGSMTALAVAQDLVTLGRADDVVVCGVDLVHGSLSQALTLMECPDLPHMRGGSTALRLRAATPGDAGSPVLHTCALLSPPVPDAPDRPMPLDGVLLRHRPSPRPAHVALSGLNTIDLACAGQLAARLWPGTPVSSRGDVRSVSADVLRLLARADTHELPMGVAGVHSLGGTGYCVAARHTP